MTDSRGNIGRLGIGWAGKDSNAYYEQLTKEKGWTPEERDKRNEAAFNWKEGDIEILDAAEADGYPDEDFEDMVPEEQPKTR